MTYSILLIDDEIVALNALETRIPWHKYGVDKVYKAFSMQQAQKLFQEYAIDIMFCDIEMPQGNGLELFEWVKSFYPYVECVYVTCHADYDYMRQALKLGSFDYILKPVDEEDVDDLFPALAKRVDLWKEKKKGSGEWRIRDEDDINDPDFVSLSKKEIIDKACGYILSHLSEQMSVSELADALHISSGYLMRIFKTVMHCSVVEYITLRRVEWSKDLLRTTGKTIQEISGDVGYPNYVYFARVFKRLTNMTQNEYRKTK